MVGSPAEHDLIANLTVAHDEDAIGVGGRPRIMGDEHDGLAQSIGRVPQQVKDFRSGRLVEVAVRLIGQEDGWSGGQRACQRHPLLLAGAQLVRAMLRLVRETHHGKELADA
ncbi:hypothetical protein BH23CHL9_BH23CHL9_07060 [soil metagenome]